MGEDRFLAIIADASARFDAGANDFVRGAARAARARSICAATTGDEIADWRGTIETLSSNSSGKGVLTVRLSRHVTVGTTNNALSDAMGMHTLIDPGSPVYEQVMGLHEGQQVVFSGRFEQDDDDCFEEASLTQEGSMHDPDYEFAFSSVRPAN